MTWILKVKVGRNWFSINIDNDEILEYNIDLYENMDKCIEIILFKLEKVIKS